MPVPKGINVFFFPSQGGNTHWLPCVELIHRHFEKNPPFQTNGKTVCLLGAPVDLLRVGGFLPSEILDQIDEVEVKYNPITEVTP